MGVESVGKGRTLAAGAAMLDEMYCRLFNGDVYFLGVYSKARRAW